jgi:replicative DNA helicase
MSDNEDSTLFMAEQSVISAMMADRAAIVKAKRLLDSTAFEGKAMRSYFNAILALDAEGITVDPLTLTARMEQLGTLDLAGGRDYIGYLLDVVPTAANVEYHARIVKSGSDRRKAIGYLTRALEDLKGGRINLRDLAVEAQAAMLPFAVDSDARGFRWITVQNIEEVLAEIDRRAEHVKDGSIPGFPTGYRDIDSVTNGFRPGELVIFGGAPKSLKSYLCINILINAAMRRDHTGLVSAEMTFHAIMERFVTATALVSVIAVGRGAITGSERERMMREGSKLAGFIAVDDEALPELGDVIARATDLKAQQPRLKALVFDYIQLVQNKMGNRRGDEEINGITRALKGTCKRLEVVGIAPAQCNFKEVDGRDDKMPQLRDFQGASGMAQDPDFAGMLLNRRQYDASAAPLLEIDFQGARRTHRFTALIKYDPTSMAMVDERTIKTSYGEGDRAA